MGGTVAPPPQSAPSSLLTWLNRNSKWLAAVVFLLAISQLQVTHATWCAAGVVCVSHLCKQLKKVLRHPRPVGTTKKDPGMPSNHATGIMYCAAYGVLECLDPTSSLGAEARPAITVTRWGLAAVMLVISIILSMLRVIFKQHTLDQVVVGCLLGGGSAAAWRQAGRAACLHHLHQHPVLRRLLIAFAVFNFCLFFIKVAVSSRRKAKARMMSSHVDSTTRSH